jgi:hypothetical protein
MKQTQTSKQAVKEMPVHSVQIGGLKIATWKNIDDKKNEFLNSTISKNYFDDKTNTWKPSTSFSVNDLMKLKVAIDDTLKFCLIDSKKKNDEENEDDD